VTDAARVQGDRSRGRQGRVEEAGTEKGGQANTG
jgi:hypothetical protein